MAAPGIVGDVQMHKSFTLLYYYSKQQLQHISLHKWVCWTELQTFPHFLASCHISNSSSSYFHVFFTFCWSLLQTTANHRDTLYPASAAVVMCVESRRSEVCVWCQVSSFHAYLFRFIFVVFSRIQALISVRSWCHTSVTLSRGGVMLGWKWKWRVYELRLYFTVYTTEGQRGECYCVFIYAVLE